MRLHYLFFLAAAFSYLLPLFGATPFTPPESRALHTRGNEKAGSSKSAGKQVAPPGRNAYVYFEIKPGFENSWDDKPDWPTCSFLWIDGDEKNGAVKLEVVFPGGYKEQPVLKYVECSKKMDVEAPEPQQTYGMKEPTGTTGVSNVDLMDQNVKGTPGILIDAIRQDPVYRTGVANKKSLNSCHNILERIVTLTEGLTTSTKSQACIQTYNKWVTEQAGEKYNIKSTIKHIEKHAGWTKDRDHQADSKKNFTIGACVERRLKRDVACALPTDESVNAGGQDLELTTSNWRPESPDGAFKIVSTDVSTAKPEPSATIEDSRNYSFLSGWHVKLIFHIG